MIVLQFVSGKDLGADLIKWFSAGGWSHVDAVLRDGLLGARSDCVGGKPAGVQVRDPSYVGDAQVLRVQLECAPAMVDAFEAFLRAQIGKPYDVEGIAGFIFGRDWRDDSAWFCSELVASALEACGFFEYPLAAPTYKVTPAALLLAISAKSLVPRSAPAAPRLPVGAPEVNGAE